MNLQLLRYKTQNQDFTVCNFWWFMRITTERERDEKGGETAHKPFFLSKIRKKKKSSGQNISCEMSETAIQLLSFKILLDFSNLYVGCSFLSIRITAGKIESWCSPENNGNRRTDRVWTEIPFCPSADNYSQTSNHLGRKQLLHANTMI